MTGLRGPQYVSSHKAQRPSPGINACWPAQGFCPWLGLRCNVCKFHVAWTRVAQLRQNFAITNLRSPIVGADQLFVLCKNFCCCRTLTGTAMGAFRQAKAAQEKHDRKNGSTKSRSIMHTRKRLIRKTWNYTLSTNMDTHTHMIWLKGNWDTSKLNFFHDMTTGYLQHINFTPQYHHCWISLLICVECSLESTDQAMPSHALIAQSLKVNLPCCVLLPVENCQLKHAHAVIATSKLQGHVFTSTEIHGHVVVLRNTVLL